MQSWSHPAIQPEASHVTFFICVMQAESHPLGVSRPVESHSAPAGLGTAIPRTAHSGTMAKGSALIARNVPCSLVAILDYESLNLLLMSEYRHGELRRLGVCSKCARSCMIP